MRPNIKNTLYRNDDVAETIGMRIDVNSLSHLMTVLTDLYSDPVMAIVREISTNARDSHVDAGVDRPIEVSLPTEGHRKFIVRDYGVGLSVEDIREVFSAYGASTKRESNEVTGMLGLGCKAPLSYTNSFTVEAIKNGVKAIASVTKDESNVGSIKILDTFETDEHNGVTVTVPVKPYDSNRFISKAQELFSYWRGGVLVDGEVPAGLDDTTHFYIDPDVALVRYKKVIVMGGVPYEVPETRNTRDGWVAWVEMGEVDFTPSREALHMTPRTEVAVKQIEAFIAERYAKVVRDELAKQPNDWERLKKYRQIQQSSFRTISGLANFRELTLPEKADAWNLRIEGNSEGRSWKASHVSVYNLIDHVGNGTKILTGFPFKRVSPLHRAMLAKLNPGKTTVWLVLPKGMSLLGYTDMPHTKWEDVPEIPKAARPKVVRNPKDDPAYDIYHKGGCRYGVTVGSFVPDGKAFAGIPASSSYTASSYSRVFPDMYVVFLPSQRVDKFFRLYEDALTRKDLDKKLDKKIKGIVKKMTPEELLRLELDSTVQNDMKRFGVHMDDPILNTLRKALNAPTVHTSQLTAIIQDLPGPSSNYPSIPAALIHGSTKVQPSEWDTVKKRYPLIFDGDRYWRNQVEDRDLITYANDRYEKYYKGS